MTGRQRNYILVIIVIIIESFLGSFAKPSYGILYLHREYKSPCIHNNSGRQFPMIKQLPWQLAVNWGAVGKSLTSGRRGKTP